MKRTDTHRPSVINPADYEYVAFDHAKIENLGDCDYILAQRAIKEAHMKRTGGTYSGHDHGGNCGICGNANAIYTATFYHAPSNSYLRVGQDCAEKLDMSGLDWNEFRKTVGNALEARAGKKKAQALLEEAGCSEAWAISLAERPACDCFGHGSDFYQLLHSNQCERNYAAETTIKDIVANVVKYGNLSEPKANYLKVLVDQIKNRPALAAKYAAEAAAAAPCPTGRVVITGTVLKVKEFASAFGSRYSRYAEPATVYKIIVKDDSGFRVYGTRPSGIQAERGDRLTFTATVEPSKDDAKFGFYKRPAKAAALPKA